MTSISVSGTRPYIYSTALAPPLAAAARQAVALVQAELEKRKHLLNLAATLRASERLAELARRYGTDTIIGAMAEVMDYSERLMRASLAGLPDGEGTFEDVCDGDGIPDDAHGRDAQFWIRMRVTKTGDRVRVDFAGSDRVVPCG